MAMESVIVLNVCLVGCRSVDRTVDVIFCKSVIVVGAVGRWTDGLVAAIAGVADMTLRSRRKSSVGMVRRLDVDLAKSEVLVCVDIVFDVICCFSFDRGFLMPSL